MADSVQRHGRDTYVGSANADAPHAGGETLLITSGQAKIYVFLPVPGVRGRTIDQATLTVPVRGSWSAQTLTATPVNEDWAPRKTTWNDQPALRAGQAIAAAQGAKTDGQRVEIDVTAHIQAIADGAKHWGWCITTGSGAANRVYAFNHPDAESWVLTIDFTEAPEAPTDLAPNGAVTGVEPVLTFDFVDLGGASTELGAVQVRVNTSASTSGAWTSAETDAVVPEFDLAASAWPTTPVSGTTYYWQVRVRDGAGYWSDWSDWASFVYAPKPALTLDNPATGIVWDPTPTIVAHISAGTIKAWRIRIAAGNDKSRILYDSGKKPKTGTTSLAHTVPFKDDRGRRILKDDATYWLNVRAWDRNDRQPTPGDPAWIQQWVQFTFDDDATPPSPTDLTVSQIGSSPRVRLTWFRDTGFPEGWVIHRDGEVIARLDPDEVDVNDNLYEWVDNGAAPWVSHSYTVKVIDGEKQSEPSNPATITTEVVGVWLLTDTLEVDLDGVDVSQLRTIDKRARYSPLNTAYDVDIVYAFAGVAGTYTGTLSTSRGRDVPGMRAALLAMKEQPHQEVQLVYASTSVPVKLSDVSALPSSTFDQRSQRHDVVFTAQQTSDFEVGT